MEKIIKSRIENLLYERKVILADITLQLENDNYNEALVDAMKIPKLNAKITELEQVLKIMC